MKKKVIFIANTYYQLITAMHLSKTEFKDVQTDLILTDISQNSTSIYKRLKKLDYFKNCYLAICKAEMTKLRELRKIKLYCEVNWTTEKWLKRIINVDVVWDYDIFVFCNTDALADAVFSVCWKNNKNVECRMYEEGWGCYTHFYEDLDSVSKRAWIKKILRILSGNKNRMDFVKSAYFYRPELVLSQPRFALNSIPKISQKNRSFIDDLNYIFSYESSKNEFEKKYVWLDGNVDAANVNTEEIQFVRRLSEAVGKENIIVKYHPRNDVDIYSKYGLTTAIDSSVPWEVIVLNANQDKLTTLTVSSSSSVMAKLIIEDCECENIMFYKVFGGNISNELEEFFERYKSIYGKECVVSADELWLKTKKDMCW